MDFITCKFFLLHLQRLQYWELLTACNPLAWVVGKVDNAIQWIAWFALLALIHWITIYLVDSIIQPGPI